MTAYVMILALVIGVSFYRGALLPEVYTQQPDPISLPNPIGLTTSMKQRIGIDMGGTKTEIMLTGSNPQEILQRKRVPTRQEKGYTFIIEQTANLIKDYVKLCDEDPLIGIGIPGSVNPETNLVRNANTVCLNGNPLKIDLEERVQLPIFVENDANCFALSEALLGAGKGKDIVIGLIMGTGMGGGIIKNGKIWSGRHGIAGEFGHTSIDMNGRDCWCGEKGCLERYISGPALEKQYREESGQELGLREIVERFEKGEDHFAKKVIEDFLMFFGRGIANVITAFDPDLVVIGGGVSNIPYLYTTGVEYVSRQVFSDHFTTPIVKNQLGDSSGIFGAALLAG